MRRNRKEWIWISDEYQVWPRKEDSCQRFSIYADQESITELPYEDLLSIRDMIDRIEQRYKKEEGGAR